MEKKESRKASGRGRISTITLLKPFVLNALRITKAKIEIDHINFGLDKKTGKLNKRKRTNFSVNDIEKFLSMLDGDYLFPTAYRNRISRFKVRIDCPIQGRFYGRQFILIFEIDYDKSDEIHTITLFPGW